ncbi:hypothetical protein R5W24_006059 [Gemmata sp. JC717]|nr:hypothetical protein [Gemmata algarum]MDY3556886.1 hypothetical protein [Gemmata algarum]
MSIAAALPPALHAPAAPRMTAEEFGLKHHDQRVEYVCGQV